LLAAGCKPAPDPPALAAVFVEPEPTETHLSHIRQLTFGGNNAEAYALDILPKARGDAARLRENALAYREKVIANAEGEASRFTQTRVEYEKAPEVTRKRMYLETMEYVLANSSKVLMQVKDGNNLMYIPLDKLMSNQGMALPTPAEEVQVNVTPSADGPRRRTSSRDGGKR